MPILHASPFVTQLRPLAAVLATLWAASAAVSAPANIVVTNCADSGTGSLRDAINTAVSDDVIDMTHLSCSTISLTTGALVMGQSIIEINGPGQNKLTIDGGSKGAVFYHLGSGALLLSNLSIANGSKYRKDGDAEGACVHAGNALYLENVTVSHCQTSAGANHSAAGGAVWAQDYAVVIGSTISGSSAVAKDFGSANGGGIYALGGLFMEDSTVAENFASSPLTRSSFGGGIGAGGEVNIVRSAIFANKADSFGGVNLTGTNPFYPAVISNSTISGNTAVKVGGVFAGGGLNLYNSTVAFNTSSLWVDFNGNYFAAGAHIVGAGLMHSSIVSKNVNSAAPFPADLTGAAGVVFTGAHNNVMACIATCPNDTTTEDPGLNDLQDNGGTTLTHKPTPGAWDRFHGDNVLNEKFDQRGKGFPRSSPPDPIEIGAFQTNSGIIFVNGFN
jgi:hypothetical protein